MSAEGCLQLDVLVLAPGSLDVFPGTPRQLLPAAAGIAPVLASALGPWLSCGAWALPAAERKALAERLRSLAWLVETCVPDEAEARCG
jgi:hypothetical protein